MNISKETHYLVYKLIIGNQVIATHYLFELNTVLCRICFTSNRHIVSVCFFMATSNTLCEQHVMEKLLLIWNDRPKKINFFHIIKLSLIIKMVVWIESKINEIVVFFKLKDLVHSPSQHYVSKNFFNTKLNLPLQTYRDREAFPFRCKFFLKIKFNRSVIHISKPVNSLIWIWINGYFI